MGWQRVGHDWATFTFHFHSIWVPEVYGQWELWPLAYLHFWTKWGRVEWGIPPARPSAQVAGGRDGRFGNISLVSADCFVELVWSGSRITPTGSFFFLFLLLRFSLPWVLSGGLGDVQVNMLWLENEFFLQSLPEGLFFFFLRMASNIAPSNPKVPVSF